MPVPGLSLVGLMEEQAAVAYLRNRCIPPDPADAALVAAWNTAKAQLGAPFATAGHPDIQEIPADHMPYLQGVMTNPRFNATIEGMANWAFKLVEVEPLLAFQFHVETNRSDDLCGASGPNPSVETMLPVCLPHQLETVQLQIIGQQNGFMIRAHSLNLRLLGAGLPIGANAAQHITFGGIGYGVSSPLIQVVSFGGRCYLKNGYHRAYGLRKAGATHIPCLLLEATDYAHVGALGGDATFERTLLESANPPTCGHFAQNRAYSVTLRKMTRMIHVGWTEYAVPDDF